MLLLSTVTVACPFEMRWCTHNKGVYLIRSTSSGVNGRIWQHALGEQYGVKPCASPAEMLTDCGAESWSWSTFSANTVSIFVS